MLTQKGRRYTLASIVRHGLPKYPRGWSELKAGCTCFIHDEMFDPDPAKCFSCGCFVYEKEDSHEHVILTCSKPTGICRCDGTQTLIVATEDATMVFKEFP